MSEENDKIEDKAKEIANDASEKVSEIAEEAKEKASEVKEDIEENAKDFKEEAKKATDEFKEGLDSLANNQENKKVLAGILALFFGVIGVHKFVLGYNKEGLILLGLTAVGYLTMCVFVGFFIIFIPIIVSFIEGIIYLTKSDNDFYQTYQANKKPWF